MHLCLKCMHEEGCSFNCITIPVKGNVEKIVEQKSDFDNIVIILQTDYPQGNGTSFVNNVVLFIWSKEA